MRLRYDYIHLYNITETEWRPIVEATRQVLASLPEQVPDASGEPGPLILAGPDGTGEPEIDNKHISFNAAGDDAGHRFYLSRRRPVNRKDLKGAAGEYAFCQTEGSRHQLPAAAVLLIADAYAPGAVAIGSSGDYESAWQPARELLDRVLGETLPAHSKWHELHA